MIFGSTYERFYGKITEKSSKEAEILRYKRFSELKLASILNKFAVAYIESWTLLNESDYFINLAFSALR